MQPLVSCVMLTRGRPQFAAAAIERFMAQTYQHRELVILDDVNDPSFTEPPAVGHYYRSKLREIGGKRNAANARSAGEYICTWDDDDESFPGRIEAQLDALRTSGRSVCGLLELEFIDLDGGDSYIYPGSESYVPGSTLLYSRDFWLIHHFDHERMVDEEKGFQTAAYKAKQLIMIPSDGLMRATKHRGNTSFRDVARKPWRKKAA